MPLLPEKKKADSLAQMVDYFAPHHPDAEGVLKCSGTVTYFDSHKNPITETLRFDVAKSADECVVTINWKNRKPPEGFHATYRSSFDVFQFVSPDSFLVTMRRNDMTFVILNSVYLRPR